MAYILTTKEAIWLGKLLFDLGKKQIEFLIIHGIIKVLLHLLKI
jgi:hypothetical protein